MILFSFGYATAVCIPPYLHVWGGYTLEGLLVYSVFPIKTLFFLLKKLLLFQLTCSFDYVTDSVSNKSFTAFFFAGCYGLPLIFVIFFYSQV